MEIVWWILPLRGRGFIKRILLWVKIIPLTVAGHSVCNTVDVGSVRWDPFIYHLVFLTERLLKVSFSYLSDQYSI